MALVYADRVKETSSTTGTGSYTLAGAVTGFRSFSVVGNGNTCYYTATDTSGNWEVGLGTYSTTGPTLARTTIQASSNSNTAVNWTSQVTLFLDLPAGVISGLAPLASPTFTGTPAAPTPANTTNSTQIATTAFVQNVVTNASYVPLSGANNITGELITTSINGFRLVANNTGIIFRNDGNAFYMLMTNVADGYGGFNSFRPFAITLSTGAISLGSPSIGSATATTQSNTTSTTQVATTAFVQNVLGANYTASDVLTKILTVDGSGSGLDADTVDGQHASDFVSLTGNQTFSGGFNVTAYNAGAISSGTFTPDPANGNYQYYTNNGAHTLAAPASDCAIDILVTNGTTGTITFSGFTVQSGGTGDAYTTNGSYKFIFSIRRINSVATYVIKALQ